MKDRQLRNGKEKVEPRTQMKNWMSERWLGNTQIGIRTRGKQKCLNLQRKRELKITFLEILQKRLE
ncbi:predicted protein [Botrytis cinerea T4]|uniref:Uncharacterized protein n=1 Tax=Botryotinia fuckeliana (strain T4) TaxID=999810 RepID=G2Y757_BOTF4|nr:predicted protein [Botrytis cinerea T4]